MRGRKPKPEKLRLIDGGVRVIGGNTPPACPDWLDGDAKAEWDRLLAELTKRYLISPLDALSLAAYCRTFAMWKEADRNIREQGLTFVADNGNIRINPAAKLCLSCFEALRRMGAEYGFTPAARSRLDCKQPATKEQDEFENFLEER